MPLNVQNPISMHFLKELNQHELMDLLLRVADQFGAKLLANSHVTMDQGELYTLYVPMQEDEELMEKCLIAPYYQMGNRIKPPVAHRLPRAAVRVAQMVPRLLFPEMSPDEGALLSNSQFLLIGPSNKTVPMVYYQLARHATHTRIAYGKDKDLQVYYHLRNEHAYGSFQAARNDPLIGDLVFLSGWSPGEGSGLLFLPEPKAWGQADQRYDEGLLNAFYRFIRTVPELFGIDPNKNLMAAITVSKQPGYFQINCVSLARLNFRNQLEMLPQEMLNAKVSLVKPMASEAACDQLQKEMKREHWAYYKIHLMPIRGGTYDKSELRNLNHEMQKLKQKIRLLEKRKERKPVLLRYEHVDFHIMVAFLRNFDKASLHDGTIRYTFQGVLNSRLGKDRPLHYLWVEPEAETSITNPELLFAISGPRTRIFSLDPFWDQEYSQHTKACLFVPQNTALHPTIHPDEVEHIDSYLAHLLRGAPFEDLEQPLVIFEGVGQTDQLEITLLDRAWMVPPKVCMGWLNDCLVLTNVEMKEVIKESGALFNYIQVAEYLENQERRVIERFERSAEIFKEDRDDAFAALCKDFHELLEEKLTTAGEQAERITELLPKLEAFVGQAKQLEKLENTSQNWHNVNDRLLGELSEKVREANANVDKGIQASANARFQVEGRINAEVVKLLNLREKLKKFFFKSLWPF